MRRIKKILNFDVWTLHCLKRCVSIQVSLSGVMITTHSLFAGWESPNDEVLPVNRKWGWEFVQVHWNSEATWSFWFGWMVTSSLVLSSSFHLPAPQCEVNLTPAMEVSLLVISLPHSPQCNLGASMLCSISHSQLCLCLLFHITQSTLSPSPVPYHTVNSVSISCSVSHSQLCLHLLFHITQSTPSPSPVPYHTVNSVSVSCSVSHSQLHLCLLFRITQSTPSPSPVPYHTVNSISVSCSISHSQLRLRLLFRITQSTPSPSPVPYHTVNSVSISVHPVTLLQAYSWFTTSSHVRPLCKLGQIPCHSGSSVIILNMIT